ncbi:hypothetical protein [Devosia sp.]|uniref:hypothetical protein n=1 Tax=Devosia sp. TaxID=1871048 RepID=UPI003262DF22
MFHVMPRIMAAIPVLAACAGWLSQPLLHLLAPLIGALFLLWRDRAIRRRVGQSAWPSDGFARHVLTDDLGNLLGLTLFTAPLMLLVYGLHMLVLPF